jgi:hypothetical protein
MGVIMQAFYWSCPDLEGKPFEWWKYLQGEIPKLAAAGFTAPPLINRWAMILMTITIWVTLTRRHRWPPGSA